MTFDRALSHLSFVLGAMTPFIGANIEYLLAVTPQVSRTCMRW